jgi:hypothetical protein
MYTIEQIREAAGSINDLRYNADLILSDQFVLRYSRTSIFEQGLPFRNYLLLQHADTPVGFLHFFGPVRDKVQSIIYDYTYSWNSLDFSINEMLGAPSCESIHLIPEYRNNGGRYRGLVNAMITAGIAIADELSIQSGERKYHLFMFANPSPSLRKCLKKYPGFELDHQYAKFFLPGTLMNIEITRSS